MRVKICGLTTLEGLRACADAGADAMGFIFARSPRRLAPGDGRAATLTRAVPAFATAVGVFADDPADLVRAAIANCRLDVLQFSGDEPPSFCGSFGRPTIIAVRDRMPARTDIDAARAVALLVDAVVPGMRGGTGVAADPARVAAVRRACPGIEIILAGGLTPANVASAIAAGRPDGVDVRTGVERDGAIDPRLVRAFVAAARAAAAA